MTACPRPPANCASLSALPSSLASCAQWRCGASPSRSSREPSATCGKRNEKTVRVGRERCIPERTRRDARRRRIVIRNGLNSVGEFQEFRNSETQKLRISDIQIFRNTETWKLRNLETRKHQNDVRPLWCPGRGPKFVPKGKAGILEYQNCKIMCAF